jgi:hypothetical protein
MSTRYPDIGSGKGESTMAATVVMPDDYVVGTDDEQVSVTYSTYGIVGPSLRYHNEADPTGVGEYTAAQIRTEQSELGDLVTVTLDENQAANGIDIETLVIWQTYCEGRTARGQIQTYDQERRVRGTAKRVGG